MTLVRRAHHVSLPVRDLERSKRFYGDLLGLHEIPRPDFGLPGVWYSAGDVELHLIVTPPGVDTGAPAPALNPLAGHLAFEIEDYGKVRDALQDRGLELLETRPEVGQMWVRDPDEHIIELIVPGGRLGRSR